MKLNDKLYDILKWVAILALPAFAQFIPKVFEIWDIPYGTQIGDTLTAVSVLLGILLGISTVTYHLQKNKEDNSNDNSN